MPQDRALLLKTGKAVANELTQRSEGTVLKIRLPRAVCATTSGGWRVVLGRLGTHGLSLEIWLDRFAGPGQRKFWFGFVSSDKKAWSQLVSNVKRKLRPHWTVTEKDICYGSIFALAKPLKRKQFGVPYFENYEDG